MPTLSNNEKQLRRLGRLPWLRTVCSRRLATLGAGGAALALSRNNDPVVRARLGMFQSAITAHENQQAGTAIENLAVISAYLRLGRFDPARALAATLLNTKHSEVLISQMLCFDPSFIAERQDVPLWAATLATRLAEGSNLDSDTLANLIDKFPDCPVDQTWLSRTTQQLPDVSGYFHAHHLQTPTFTQGQDPNSSIISSIRCETHQSHSCDELVTVVLCARDVEKYIAVALNSVLSQSWTNLEILVVDDASTDQTAAIIRDIVNTDPRVKLIVNANSKGVYHARNLALQRASGDFITFHDGDDWSHPQKIERQVSLLIDQPDKLASLSQMVRINDSGKFTLRLGWSFPRLNMSSLMFRREPVLQELGMFHEVVSGADEEYVARIRLKYGAASVAKIRKVLSFATDRKASLTHSSSDEHNSVHQIRITYCEAWRRWHRDCYLHRLDAYQDDGIPPFSMGQN